MDIEEAGRPYEPQWVEIATAVERVMAFSATGSGKHLCGKLNKYLGLTDAVRKHGVFWFPREIIPLSETALVNMGNWPMNPETGLPWTGAEACARFWGGDDMATVRLFS